MSVLKIACKLKGNALICGYRHPLYDRLLDTSGQSPISECVSILPPDVASSTLLVTDQMLLEVLHDASI